MRTLYARVESPSVERSARHLQRLFDVATAVAAAATPVVIGALALDLPSGLEQTLSAINWCLWAVFAVELVVMLAVSRDRRDWLRRYPVTPVIVLLTVPALGGLDLFRVVRLLRGKAARRAADAVTSEAGLRNLAMLTLVTIGLGGVFFAEVEPDVSVSEGLYWSMQTVTTVGYGDVVPTTTGGKILAVYVMLLGVGFLAILTGAVAERFMARWRQEHGFQSRFGSAPEGGDPVLAKLDELGERLARLERAVTRGG